MYFSWIIRSRSHTDWYEPYSNDWRILFCETRFPFSRSTILKKWIHAVRRKNFKPTSASRICSVHFRDSDFVQNPALVVKKLKEDAVPSKFPSFPDHLQPKNRVERRSNNRNVCYNQIRLIWCWEYLDTLDNVLVVKYTGIHHCKQLIQFQYWWIGL